MTVAVRIYWAALWRFSQRPIVVILLTLTVGAIITCWNIHLLRALATDLQRSISDISSFKESKSKISPQITSEHCLDTRTSQSNVRQPIVWINGKSRDHSYLKHVRRLFDILGYHVHESHNGTPAPPSKLFDILWNHEYPFTDLQLRPIVDTVDGSQLINHVPGSGYYTSKVELASLDISGIPPAFALPKNAAEFEHYFQDHPELLWVQKSNAHRGIRVLPIEEVDLNADGTFVQQFIRNPLLIDGRKFDVGIYTVVTSVSPLRVYIYDSDILLRFCSLEHEPFNANNIDSYVVGDDYTPLWEMPSLSRLYREMGLSFKEAFDTLLKREYGVSAEVAIHSKIRRIIRQVFQTQNANMRESLKKFRRKDVFFELSRFDFVVDENFNVFLMEANMSPNLSSGHFKENRFLYEALIFDILSLVGAAQRLSGLDRQHAAVAAPDRQLNIYSKGCENDTCLCQSLSSKNETIEWNSQCVLCSQCLTKERREILRRTYNEQFVKRGMRRIVPCPRSDCDDEGHSEIAAWMTEEDELLTKWLAAKCATDTIFC